METGTGTDRAYAAIAPILNDAQRAVLYPPGVRGVIGLDIFAGSITWDEHWDPMPHAGRAGLREVVTAGYCEYLRPELAPDFDRELERITRLLVENRWPFRIHATYDESIRQFLDVFERVNRDMPFDGLRFIIDHAETIRPESIERIRALDGGIAIQHRMAFQGEYFVDRFGAGAAEATPPIHAMLKSGVPLGAGTDATRVASYDPWVALYWLVTGKTLGGMELYPEGIDRRTALELWTKGSAWFSGEKDVKGTLSEGQYADLAVLSDDYFEVAAEDIRSIVSVLTVVDGEIVYGAGRYSDLNPPVPPASPGWSPVTHYDGVWRGHAPAAAACAGHTGHSCSMHGADRSIAWSKPIPAKNPHAFWGALGCSCFAF